MRSRLLRHVFFFGLPLVLGLAAHALFNLVDTLLVGHLGEVAGARAISVTGLCDPITTFQTILFNGPIAGAGVLLSLRHGANDLAGLRQIALRATGFVIALSILMGVPGFLFAEEIARAMGARPGWQLEDCTRYLQILLGGGITAGMFLYLTTIERALGRTTAFLIFFMLSNILNAVFGVLLVYGDGVHPGFVPAFLVSIAHGLEIPRLGVIGSAWATVLARGVAGLLVLAWCFRRGVLRGSWRWLWPQGKAVLALIRIGLWNNGQVAARGIAGGVLIRTLQEAGGGNPAVVGGVFVGLKIELLLVLLAFGWGAASQTLVATSLGAGKPERAAHEERMAIVLATMFGAVLVVPAFVFADGIAAVFNPEPELVRWSATYVQYTALAFVFTPISVVVSQSMIARNRLRIPVMMDSIALLGLMSPALVIAVLAGAGVITLIVINATAHVLLAVAYLVVRRRLIGNGAYDRRALQ
jgi:Na+-driven multidrug efflux pump